MSSVPKTQSHILYHPSRRRQTGQQQRLDGKQPSSPVTTGEDFQVRPSFKSGRGIDILQNDELGVDLQRSEVIEEAVLKRCRRQRA